MAIAVLFDSGLLLARFVLPIGILLRVARRTTSSLEALNTTTIRGLTPSHPHQILAIAPASESGNP